MGEVFAGRYELVDPIGRGGVGAVWRAWDHRRRRYVAAKVLQQSDAHALLRFVREQALRIDHPHVLAPASWAADDDKVLFTMDLVAGGSLAHWSATTGRCRPRFVCTLLDQLLAGLAAVHAEGVVHRDIKPANILLEATGTGRPHLRLSDFGIAMRMGEPRLTETNYVVGTPGYFAPEQMLGAEPDFPADLFAVGLVALYLLEGAEARRQGADRVLRRRTARRAPRRASPSRCGRSWPAAAAGSAGAVPHGHGGAQGARRGRGAAARARRRRRAGRGLRPTRPAARRIRPGGTAPATGRCPVRTAGARAGRLRPRSPHHPGPPVHPTPPAPAAPGTPGRVVRDRSRRCPRGFGDGQLPPPAAAPRRGRRRPARRPPAAPYPQPPARPRTGGNAPPPPKVAAGIVLAALLCFAVGIWALTQL